MYQKLIFLLLKSFVLTIQTKKKAYVTYENIKKMDISLFYTLVHFLMVERNLMQEMRRVGMRSLTKF